MIEQATGASPGSRICAVVVTFKRPHLLRDCLTALQGQTRVPDEILVVDNNSGDETLEMLRADFSDVMVLALPINSGGAGGFHAGMNWAHQNGFDWTWVMDDDGVPAPDCLANLLAKAQQHGIAVYGPVCVRPDAPGKLSFPSPLADEFGAATMEREVLNKAGAEDGVLHGWASLMNGILFPRAAIEKAGLPRSEMFIWGDEVEFAKRIKRSGFEIYTVLDALHQHPQDRIQWASVLHPKLTVYSGPLDWKAFCFFRNSGLIAKKYGRGLGITMLVRYFFYYLVARRLDWRSLLFFLRAYVAGWREDFSRAVPY